MTFSPEELELLADLKRQAMRKNCVVSLKGGHFNLYRKIEGGVVFVGKRNTLDKFADLVKKA
jgi:hypothetical protein